MIKPLTLLVLSALALNVHAKVDSAQAARLGQDLTPLGAERAGNIAGTIPEWAGGITTPPAGYQVGMHHLDPYAANPAYESNSNCEPHPTCMHTKKP